MNGAVKDYIITIIASIALVIFAFGLALLTGCSDVNRIAAYCLENPRNCD